MPQRKNALKELRKNRKNRLRNITVKTELKKTIKQFVALARSNPEEAKKALDVVYKKLDKAAKRNILPKNTAARRKSRYTKLLKTQPAKKA